MRWNNNTLLIVIYLSTDPVYGVTHDMLYIMMRHGEVMLQSHAAWAQQEQIETEEERCDLFNF